ncbi:MAG: hypothetical protein CVU42_07520 [Chloroflexi bacterium HGW-Chloroflexi-4]|jgi:cell shape-determining protein MreD|nr:MAG: hypothetical protein CVU42_07520 [Chloroflexi bacterium HGW-Chloroflexi-4]
MGTLLAFPIIFILILLQTTLFSQVTLLHGSVDLVLLWIAAWSLQKQVRSTWFWAFLAAIAVAYISAMPWFVPVVCYPLATLFAKWVNKRVWQSPLLMMFLVTLVISIVSNGLSYIALAISGVSIPINTGLVQVMIPSVLINLLLALPVFAIVRDTAQWVYPLEVVE